jgi:hypothetical protein
MPNDYETAHGFDPGNALDGAVDSDEDGVPNADEYTAGTDPRDGTSYFHVGGVARQAAGFAVHFQALPLREYDIWYARQLLGAIWSNATPVSLAVPVIQDYEWIDEGSYTSPAPDDPSLTSRFYRVNVRLNP